MIRLSKFWELWEKLSFEKNSKYLRNLYYIYWAKKQIAHFQLFLVLLDFNR